MKGLILAAGLGTRLRPITSLKPKPTIAVANKPLIHHAVDNLVQAGVNHIGIVVSVHTAAAIEECVANYPGVTFEFIQQNPPKGLAHAVEVSQGFLGNEPFVMYLSDNLFEHGIADFVRRFEEGQHTAVMALVPVSYEAAKSLGVAAVDGDRITRLVEKPADPPSTLAIAGVYVFNPKIHQMIEGLQPGAKGEYQITDAIQRLIEAGEPVAPVEVTGWWKDTGKPEDILDANRLLLMNAKRNIEGVVTEDSTVTGEVVLGEGAVISNSTVVGPVIIGAGTRVHGSYLGPYTAIGDGCTISESQLEYSAVGNGSVIENVSKRIKASLIGDSVRLSGGTRGAEHQLIIGDESVIELRE